MKTVEIIEVGPRDGFQNLKKYLTLKEKKLVIEGLGKANFKHIQLGSFVNTKMISQMIDSPAIFEWYEANNFKYDYDFLVPTFHYAEKAINCGIKNLTFVLSVSEAHNKANVNRTVQQSFDELGKIIEKYPKVKIKIDLATAFECPFSGITPFSDLEKCMNKARALGIDYINICDTMGSAAPKQVKSYLHEISKEWDKNNIILHFHDTLGMGISNIAVALEEGFFRFENSIGGLGGCPFAPGAAGNLGTEDVAYFLNKQGVPNSVKFNALLKVIDTLKEAGLGESLASHVSKYYLNNSNSNQLFQF